MNVILYCLYVQLCYSDWIETLLPVSNTRTCLSKSIAIKVSPCQAMCVIHFFKILNYIWAHLLSPSYRTIKIAPLKVPKANFDPFLFEVKQLIFFQFRQERVDLDKAKSQTANTWLFAPDILFPFYDIENFLAPCGIWVKRATCLPVFVKNTLRLLSEKWDTIYFPLPDNQALLVDAYFLIFLIT